MTKFVGAAFRPLLPSLLLFGITSGAVWAQDLSRYRDFQLGADLPSIVKLTGATASQVKVLDSRPALIQETSWRPRALGSPTAAESVQEVVFTFYNGALFRIVVNYDRYETEGMTADDMIEAISASYGTAGKFVPAIPPLPGNAGDPEQMLAQWQDARYRFDLMRSSYGPTFQLVGVLKKLEAPALAATAEAKRLDVQEAPERDAARAMSEAQEAQAKLDKARLVNKPKFRP